MNIHAEGFFFCHRATVGPSQESKTKPARAPRLGGPPKRVRSPAGLQTKAKAAGPPRLSGKAGQRGGAFTYNFSSPMGSSTGAGHVDTRPGQTHNRGGISSAPPESMSLDIRLVEGAPHG